MNSDLYATLGLSRGASVDEIRKSYKKLAMEHHPDKGGDPEKFKEISQAHEILSDDQKKQHYDMTGSISEQQSSGMPFDMSEMFGHMFAGGFPGGFAGGFPGGFPGERRSKDTKGPGKSQDLPLRISDYYYGRSLSIKLGRHCFCKTCKGTGAASTKQCDECGGQGQVRQLIQMGPIQMLNQGPCMPCKGKGQINVGQCSACQGRSVIPDEKTLEIKIEPGMMSGNTLVFPGMCSDTAQFKEAGDVTIVLRDADEEGDAGQWMRDGTRLKTSITISLSEALLGVKKVLRGHPGFPNGVPIEIPPGVQNMWSGTIPTLGMPVRGTPKFGDAYVSILVTPTPEELEALKVQTILLKSIMPPLPPVPECQETTRIGRWAAV